MQETISTTNKTQFVFRPKYEVKTDFITSDYLRKMPRDENLRYEHWRGNNYFNFIEIYTSIGFSENNDDFFRLFES
ncbi:MAG: hypothetical protein ACR2MD_14975 [Aridibacter sp.]